MVSYRRIVARLQILEGVMGTRITTKLIKKLKNQEETFSGYTWPKRIQEFQKNFIPTEHTTLRRPKSDKGRSTWAARRGDANLRSSSRSARSEARNFRRFSLVTWMSRKRSGINIKSLKKIRHSR